MIPLWLIWWWEQEYQYQGLEQIIRYHVSKDMHIGQTGHLHEELLHVNLCQNKKEKETKTIWIK